MSQSGEHPRIFLCHTSEDKPRVMELYRQLQMAGYQPWLDKFDLLPGQDWRREIRKIITDPYNIVVICLSRNSTTKRGVVQEEMKWALDVLDQQPEDTIYLIPARLEECQPPDRLGKRHWVDLFESDGFEYLKRALDYELGNRSPTSVVSTEATPTKQPSLNPPPIAPSKPEIIISTHQPYQEESGEIKRTYVKRKSFEKERQRDKVVPIPKQSQSKPASIAPSEPKITTPPDQTQSINSETTKTEKDVPLNSAVGVIRAEIPPTPPPNLLEKKKVGQAKAKVVVGQNNLEPEIVPPTTPVPSIISPQSSPESQTPPTKTPQPFFPQQLVKPEPLTQKLLMLTRDPLWQILGVLVAISGVAWVVYTSYDNGSILVTPVFTPKLPVTTTPTKSDGTYIADTTATGIAIVYVNTSTPTLTHTPPLPSATLLLTDTSTITPAPPTPTVIPTQTPIPATDTPTSTPVPSNTSLPTNTPLPIPIQEPTSTSNTSLGLNVGDTKVRTFDDMVMLYVPGGTFSMGSAESDTDVFDPEKPQHQVTLDAFWIDKYEVSNSQFGRFVKATNYRTNREKAGYGWAFGIGEFKQLPGVDWKHPYGPDADIYKLNQMDYPVIQVNWDDAQAYCAWVGGRLPTEAEWEYAARGREGRIYPWGNTFDGSRLNFCDRNCWFGWSDKSVDDGYGMAAPVGSFPNGAGWVGALDMAGNVWEWVNDRYADNYYASSPSQNPKGPTEGMFRVLRGGSWNFGTKEVRTAYRNNDQTVPLYADTGFRCAADAP